MNYVLSIVRGSHREPLMRFDTEAEAEQYAELALTACAAGETIELAADLDAETRANLGLFDHEYNQSDEPEAPPDEGVLARLAGGPETPAQRLVRLRGTLDYWEGKPQTRHAREQASHYRRRLEHEIRAQATIEIDPEQLAAADRLTAQFLAEIEATPTDERTPAERAIGEWMNHE